MNKSSFNKGLTHLRTYIYSIKLLILMGLYLSSVPVVVAQEEAVSEQVLPSERREEPLDTPIKTDKNATDNTKNLADNSHRYVTQQLNAFIKRVDNFFGGQRADAEAPSSFLRLRLGAIGDEEFGVELNSRVRGHIALPKTQDRLNIFFSQKDDDEFTALEEAEDIDLGENDEELGLQYSKDKNKARKLIYRIGINSKLDTRVSVRQRRNYNLSKTLSFRHNNRMYWKEEIGFGVSTVGDLDKLLDENRLLRWSNGFAYEEGGKGIQWATTLTLHKKLNKKETLSYSSFANGDTRPEYLTKNYGLKVLYRKNVWREWFYFELEPAYVWRREFVERNRKGIAIFTARIELHFNDDYL